MGQDHEGGREGLLQNPHPSGVGYQRSVRHRPFPKWEQKSDGSWSVRNISNWKESEGNAATAMRERYMPDDLTTAYNVVRALKRALGEHTVLNT